LATYVVPDFARVTRQKFMVVFTGSDAMLGPVVNSVKIASCVLSTFIVCSAAVAIGGDSSNPYQGIVDRNVFGLKPLPPPGKPEEKKVDLPPITLTGITTILGNKRALMNVQSPGKPPKPLILAEGQREDEIEVLEIDEKAGSVKISQSGTVIPLNFEKNGVKLPAAVPAVMPQPAQVHPVAAGAGNTPQAPIPYVPGAPPPVSTGLKTIPQRQIRLPQPGVVLPASGAPGGPGFQHGNSPPQGGPPVPAQ
jgi:hypothetical protein